MRTENVTSSSNSSCYSNTFLEFPGKVNNHALIKKIILPLIFQDV